MFINLKKLITTTSRHLPLVATLAFSFCSPAFSADFEFAPKENFKRGAPYLLDKKSGLLFATGAVAFTWARTQDVPTREAYAHQNRLQGSERLGSDFIGTGVPGALLGASFWAYGLKHENSGAVHSGQAQLEAMLTAFVATSALKWTVRRERPDGSDSYSFPSGHTSTVAASAMTLAEFYGWKAAVPGAVLTLVTGLSRVVDDRHWLSDTIGGAVVGAWAGHAMARAHLDQMSTPETTVESSAQVEVFPWIVAGDAAGITLMISGPGIP